MAKLVASFDTYYGLESYDGKQALAQFRSTPGVQALRAYKADASPAYVVEVDVDDAAVDDMKKQFQGGMASYAGFISNFSMKVLKDIKL
ncbi:MAG: hypothetical protein ACYC5O_24450 [Anaerolineae bacterium]